MQLPKEIEEEIHREFSKMADSLTDVYISTYRDIFTMMPEGLSESTIKDMVVNTAKSISDSVSAGMKDQADRLRDKIRGGINV